MPDGEAAKDSSSNRLRWTIGYKLTAIVLVCATIGYAGLIAAQVNSFSESALSLTQKKTFHVSNLLASQIAGGVQWKKPKAIARAYSALTDDPESTLLSLLVMDRAGRALQYYAAPNRSSVNLSGEIAVAQENLRRGETYRSDGESYTVFVLPVTYSARNLQVGTLAIAWSLAPLQERIAGEIQRQIAIGLGTLVALFAMTTLLLNRAVGRPLNDVTQTTLKLSQGEKNIEIPYASRQDEVGDLARSLLIFKQNLETIDQLRLKQQAQTELLSEALDREKSYNVMQSEFVAMASHEFRTPLTIIDSGAQRIERRLGRMDAEQLKAKTKQIRNAVQRMTALIESVLNSASFDAGKFKIEIEACNLKEIVATVCQRQQEISPSHNIAVNLRDLPTDIMGDPRLLEQVYTNLLSNAVKYAPDDPQIIVIGFQEDNQACVSVTDHGVGVPVLEQEKIFDRYFRASTSSGIAGTGIGLNLVAQTVELHGGEVDIQSVEGEGTTFTVRLPVRTPTGSVKSDSTMESGFGRAVAAAQNA